MNSVAFLGYDWKCYRWEQTRYVLCSLCIEPQPLKYSIWQWQRLRMRHRSLKVLYKAWLWQSKSYTSAQASSVPWTFKAHWYAYALCQMWSTMDGGLVEVLKIDTYDNHADMFTKSTPSDKFDHCLDWSVWWGKSRTTRRQFNLLSLTLRVSSE